jgi:hypothetical protein
MCVAMFYEVLFIATGIKVLRVLPLNRTFLTLPRIRKKNSICSRSFIQPEVQRSVVHRTLNDRMHEYNVLMTNVDALSQIGRMNERSCRHNDGFARFYNSMIACP